MPDTPFDWNGLAQYKAEGRFLDGYPDDRRTEAARGRLTRPDSLAGDPGRR